MPEKKKAAFLDDLRAVLEKHNASIGYTMEGDTHGIHQDNISFEIDGYNWESWEAALTPGTKNNEFYRN